MGQRTAQGTKAVGHTLGILQGTCLRGVGVVLLEVDAGTLLQQFNAGTGFLLVLRQTAQGKLAVEPVGCNVVKVKESYAGLLDHLAIPTAIRVVATLDATARPFVMRLAFHRMRSLSAVWAV